MSLQTLYYWLNQANRTGYCGPREGAVLLKNGQVITLDFTDWRTRSELNAVDHKTVAAVFTKAPRGGWTGQATVPNLHGGTHNICSRDAGNDFEAAKAALASKVAEYETEFARLETSPEAKFEALLKSHDWYSHYSDDHSVWAAGERSWKLIQEQAKLVDSGKARELFEKHAPEDSTCPF